MASINLENQEEFYNSLSPIFNDLVTSMNLRSTYWNDLNLENRQKLMEKDKILKLEYDHYKFLEKYFGGM